MNDYNINVRFSCEAPVQIAGRWYSPLARNSYTARVEFPDGFVCLMALPTGACERGAGFYMDRVLMNAGAMHRDGVTSGWMRPKPAVLVSLLDNDVSIAL